MFLFGPQIGHREKAMSKVWFITGSNSGIGLGIANAALAEGDRVVATGRSMGKLRAAFADINPEKIELVQLDVTEAAQAGAAVQKTVNRFGRIDVLVNNAGYSILGNFEELTQEDFQNLFQANFYGAVNVLRAALPVLRKQRSGHIINVSSTAGAVGLKHCSAYCATKFALEGLSTALATEVEQFGINVTVIEPGFFRTNLIDKGSVKYAPSTIADYAHEGPAEEMWSKYNGMQPGDPVKLGKVVVKISGMEKPLKLFVAGGDGLDLVTPVIEERLKTMQANAELSKSTAISE
jgi:NAD(P)-dependent dehydrogenase (short-subunit alcohol dehydrogenase family)